MTPDPVDIMALLEKWTKTPIPQETLDLVAPISGRDAAEIGWANCFQMIETELKSVKAAGYRIVGPDEVVMTEEEAFEWAINLPVDEWPPVKWSIEPGAGRKLRELQKAVLEASDG